MDGSIDDRNFAQFRVITLALILFNVFSVDANPSNSVHYCIFIGLSNFTMSYCVAK